MSFKYKYHCPNESCNKEHEFTIYEGWRGSYWEPPEPPELDGPDECDCGTLLNGDTILSDALENKADSERDYREQED